MNIIKNSIFKFCTFAFFFIVCFSIMLSIFYPIFNAKYLLFEYAVNPFDIVSVYPETWRLLKKLYILFYSFFLIILYSKISKKIYSIQEFIYSKFFQKTLKNALINQISNIELSLFVGFNENTPIFLDEKGLYQNILITGTIGTGKTSSAMYPFTKQLIEYKAYVPSEKLSLLILDVKGNYFNQILEFAHESNRLNDIISIDLSRKI